MDNSFKAAKAAPRKGKLPLLAVACMVLIFSVAALIQSFERDGVPLNESTISQIISEPADWENKTVRVKGIVEDVPLGIVQPFNYWLSDRQNQTMRIGLRWHSDSNLSGRSATVSGVVKKGYAWVNPTTRVGGHTISRQLRLVKTSELCSPDELVGWINLCPQPRGSAELRARRGMWSPRH